MQSDFCATNSKTKEVLNERANCVFAKELHLKTLKAEHFVFLNLSC